MGRIFPAVMVIGLLIAAAAFGQNFRGTYTMTSGDVKLTLILDQDPTGRITGTLSSTKGTQFGLEGKINGGTLTGTCTGDAGQSYFEAEFEGNKLIFTLVEINAAGAGSSRSLEFSRVPGGAAKQGAIVPSVPGGASPKPQASEAPVAAPPPPAAAQTDSSLMRYFAGEYYSYSSGSTIYGGAGTERTVTLCPDGLYRDSYEFSASGTGSWGGASSGRGAARWSIQGDRIRGVIIVAYANGQTKRITYEVVSKNEGAILFGGVKFAFAGAPKCR